VPTELREYVVRPGAMAEFVRVFTEQVVPLRRRFGFRVEGVWVDEPGDRFVWAVSHPAPDGWEAAVGPYQEARVETVHPDPTSFLAEVKTSLVTPLDVVG
jgi:NIPSNAP